MHFLGLAGMPRRIPDFPDAYNEWNGIASADSLFYSFYNIFIYVIFVTFTSNDRVGLNDVKIVILIFKLLK